MYDYVLSFIIQPWKSVQLLYHVLHLLLSVVYLVSCMFSSSVLYPICLFSWCLLYTSKMRQQKFPPAVVMWQKNSDFDTLSHNTTATTTFYLLYCILIPRKCGRLVGYCPAKYLYGRNFHNSYYKWFPEWIFMCWKNLKHVYFAKDVKQLSLLIGLLLPTDLMQMWRQLIWAINRWKSKPIFYIEVFHFNQKISSIKRNWKNMKQCVLKKAET